jgi:hypothetical protein
MLQGQEHKLAKIIHQIYLNMEGILQPQLIIIW